MVRAEDNLPFNTSKFPRRGTLIFIPFLRSMHSAFSKEAIYPILVTLGTCQILKSEIEIKHRNGKSNLAADYFALL